MESVKSDTYSTIVNKYTWILRREIILTWRMLSDNFLINVFPFAIFALASGLYAELGYDELSYSLLKALIVGIMTAYIFESWNQSRSADEDSINKPHRPVPSGYTTEQALGTRAWLALLIWPILVFLLGLWPLVLLWPAVSVWQAVFAPVKYHYCWKWITNFIGPFVAIGTGWHISTDIDSTAWSWILVLSIFFTLACFVEDIRDIEGDRSVGRRTPVMILGESFIRWWFAILMFSFPFVIWFILAPVSNADGWQRAVCSVAIGIVAWTCAYRNLSMRENYADRRTYQLFYVVMLMAMSSAPLMLK